MNTKFDKFKVHFKENRKFYIGVGTGVAFAGITCLIMRDEKPTYWAHRSLKEPHTMLDAGVDRPARESMGSFFFGQSTFGSVTNVNNAVTTVHKGSKGHPGFVTRCVETGEIFATQGDAAKAFDIPPEFLSKHLNYGRDLSENLHFERIGVLS